MLKELNANEMDLVSGGSETCITVGEITTCHKIPDAPGNYEPNPHWGAGHGWQATLFNAVDINNDGDLWDEAAVALAVVAAATGVGAIAATGYAATALTGASFSAAVGSAGAAYVDSNIP